MKESYSVTQDLSYWEYVGLSIYMAPRNKLFKRFLIYISCIGIFSALGGIIGVGEKEEVSVGSVLLRLFAPLLSLLLIFLVLALLVGLFIMIFKREVLQNVTFTFTHWGLVRVASKSESSIPWKDFQDVKESKRFILLFVKEKNLNNIYAIKKASLASPAFEDELVEFIERNRPL